MRKYYFGLGLIILTACNHDNSTASQPINHPLSVPVETINKVADIKLPAGYTRITSEPNSFTSWLRNLSFKTDKIVYLYNGEKKRNQSAQFAVIDMSRSKTDLQQCADVVIRLRAEYLYANKKFDSIRFMDFNHKWYIWTGVANRPKFDKYLQNVFGWCGSASLEKQLHPVENFSGIQPGDVLIKGGFPGHAVIVADMAINNKGEKIFLLIQGYQPAQDIHLLVNPSDQELSPWYKIPGGEELFTPEWTFTRHQLARW